MSAGAAICPLCGSSLTSVKFEGTGDWSAASDQAFRCTTTTRVRPEVLECGACRHQFSNPEHWPEDLGGEYSTLEDNEYLGMIDIKRRTFGKAADLVCRFVRPPARMLEVGSYVGTFLDICRQRGFDVTGIEPSRWGAELAQTNGLDVRNGIAEDLLGGGDLGVFDAVVSWDVLEHVTDPAHFMTLAAQHVAPGGFLIVSTLDRTNWFARAMGKRWPWLIPMHLHYFDQQSVISMAESCGLIFITTAPHVHYTSAGYALRRLLGHGDHVTDEGRRSVLDRVIFPVGFGDVRLYVFRRPDPAPSR